MFIHETQIRVRYGETDQMGYLYYGNYPLYYEVSRAEAIRSLGLSYRDLEEKHHIMMPVMSLSMRYVRPAYYDDLLTIKSTVRRLPEKTISFYVEIFNEQKKLVNGGYVKLCFVNKQSSKTTLIPKVLLDKILPFFK